jgi:DNA-binding MarR family transcriptional regulator
MNEKQWDLYLQEVDSLFCPVNHFISSEFEKRMTEGFSLTQLCILRCINREPRINISVLADKVSLSPAGVSKMVQQMVKSKLLKRRRSKEDRRAVMLELTDHGKTTLEANIRIRQKIMYELLHELSEDELSCLHTVLEKAYIKTEESNS